MAIELYPRGYLLCSGDCQRDRFELPETYSWLHLNDSWQLALHRDTRCVIVKKTGRALVLIGRVLDVDDMAKAETQIARDVFRLYFANTDLTANAALLDYLDALCGRFALFIIDGLGLRAINDLQGNYSIYYHEKLNILSSHYNIIQSFSHDGQANIFYPDIITEYRARGYSRVWCAPADMSLYANISLLVPNYCLSLPGYSLARIWPRGIAHNKDIYSVAENLAISFQSIMEELSRRESLVIGLTGGFDSRMTLAACKRVADKIDFFTFYSGTKVVNPTVIDMNNNLRIASDIAADMELRHHPMCLSGICVSEEDSAIYYQNHYHYSNRQMAVALYNHGFDKHWLHIRSIHESYRRSYFVMPPRTDMREFAAKLALWAGYRKNTPSWPQVHTAYLEYIDKYGLASLPEGYNYGDLYFSEYRMAQWMSAVLKETDPFLDTFIPMNCRKLVNLALSVPKEAKDMNLLARLMIEASWPELLERHYYPNEMLPLSKRIDFNADFLPGSVKFFNTFDQKPLVNVTAGNTEGKDSVPKPFLEIAPDFIRFGFGGTAVAKGDFINLSFDLHPMADRYYYLSFCLSSTWLVYVTVDICVCKFIINGKTIHAVSSQAFSRPNQFVYCFRHENNESLRVDLRLCANRAASTPMLHSFFKLDKMLFREEYSLKPQEPYFTSTDRLMKNEIDRLANLQQQNGHC